MSSVKDTFLNVLDEHKYTAIGVFIAVVLLIIGFKIRKKQWKMEDKINGALLKRTASDKLGKRRGPSVPLMRDAESLEKELAWRARSNTKDAGMEVKKEITKRSKSFERAVAKVQKAEEALRAAKAELAMKI